MEGGGIKANLLRHGLRWSTVSAFMRLRVAQVAGAIPLIGYLLLWSEKLSAYLAIQFTLGGYFGTTTRLLLVYYGATALLFAWAVFWFFCPSIVQRHPSLEDYLQEQLAINDSVELRRVVQGLEKLIEEKRGPGGEIISRDWRSGAPALMRDDFGVGEVADALAAKYATDNHSTLFRAHYRCEEGRNFWVMVVAAGLSAAGTILLFIPALEVFVLVTRRYLWPF